MSGTAFTKNHSDHSNDTGYQFEFFCDKCGNGWRSSFQANKLGMAQSFFRAAGSLFGGGLERAAYATGQAKDMLRGKAWDDAFAVATAEGRVKFKQCSRCGHWVCPEVCWNEERGLCENCAPRLEEELASAQATAAKEQVWEKSRTVDQTGGVDVSKKAGVGGACTNCGAPKSAGKFCGECGKPFASVKENCGQCGAKFAGKAKFCPECGTPRG